MKSTKEPLIKRLSHYFEQGTKDACSQKVGVEWEKIGVMASTLEAIPYDGEAGVEALFRRLERDHGWMATHEKERIVALHKENTSLTLEPGGQIELSGRQAFTLLENENELNTHLSELGAISREYGIIWIGVGVHPIASLDSIAWVPKKRYQIMRQHLGASDMTHWMMKATASIQVSIDYTGAHDAYEKFDLATRLSPFLSAIFANSPIVMGRPSGYHSYRGHIWNNTARQRTGLVSTANQGSLNVFEQYAQYALKVPMLFSQDNQGTLNDKAYGMDFETFVQANALEGQDLDNAWHLHLSTIFTDVRLKKYIEIRCFDCQNPRLAMAAPAVIKGLFYDEQSRQKAAVLLPKNMNVIGEFRQRLPEQGLECCVDNWRANDLCREIVELAQDGLKRITRQKDLHCCEACYLDPLLELTRKGQSPSSMLLKSFEAATTDDQRIKSILDYGRLH